MGSLGRGGSLGILREGGLFICRLEWSDGLCDWI